ncbi:universal stress protein [Halorientalis brevis]|uniref:Universal stress protein n=1 Tax=Halorientalis brevis TaxID=1126241 RepID=A0ABD6C9D4_9EURY|nr:universal stress protein [Halorientalis brevis]
MISRVLVAMDDSEMAEQALRYALEAFPDASVTAFTVVGEPSPMFGQATSIALADDVEEAAEEHAATVFERARELAADYDTEIDTDVQLGNPIRAIINRAEDFDTVVIGSHGGNLSDTLVIGNVAEKVFRRSPVPVTVVR